MGAIRKGRYPGHANTIFGSKAFIKPSLGKVVFRLPGVNRKSEKVLARNEHMRTTKPATSCKGKDWDAFTACLSQKLS